MTTLEVGKKLVELCKQGKNDKAIEALYDQNIVSVEAASMPNMPQQLTGLDSVKSKNKWWSENHLVHSAFCRGSDVRVPHHFLLHGYRSAHRIKP